MVEIKKALPILKSKIDELKRQLNVLPYYNIQIFECQCFVSDFGLYKFYYCIGITCPFQLINNVFLINHGCTVSFKIFIFASAINIYVSFCTISPA